MNADRRAFLATVGAAIGAATAGCLSGDGGADVGDAATGYAPESVVPDDPPAPPDADPASFETISVGEAAVPLVPIDVAHAWYLRREARFADARGVGQYQQRHVAGAASSPAPDGRPDGPVSGWPKEDRIVTYCRCPHHLSSLRASSLIRSGYERVYALDEGFGAWIDRDYAMAGTAATGQAHVVEGRTDPTDAGQSAWAVYEPGDRMEATSIGADGSYRMTLHFGSLSPDAPITVRTPSYTVTLPLSQATAGPVTAPD